MVGIPYPQKVRSFLKKKLRKVDLSRICKYTEGLEQAKAFWAEIKAQHPNARHHCWAAVAGVQRILNN